MFKLFVLSVLAPLAYRVDITENRRIVVGNSKNVDPVNPLNLYFSGPGGWVYARPTTGSLVFCLAAGNGSTFNGWYRWDRQGSVYVTGSDTPGQVQIFASERTRVDYVAGYAGKEYNGYRCNELHVSSSHLHSDEDFNRPSVRCYIDFLLREDISVSGEKGSHTSAWVYHKGLPSEEEYTGTKTLTGLAISLIYSGDVDGTSGVDIASKNSQEGITISTDNPVYLDPGAVGEDGGYSWHAAGEQCKSFAPPPEKNDPPLGLIIGCVVGVIAVIVIIVIVVVCVKKRHHGVKNESSSSSSDSSKTRGQQTQYPAAQPAPAGPSYQPEAGAYGQPPPYYGAAPYDAYPPPGGQPVAYQDPYYAGAPM